MKTQTCLIALTLAAVAAAGCDGEAGRPGELERLGVRRAALSCPIQASTTVVFYGETGAGGVEANSRLWVKHFLDWWRAHDPAVVYAELKAAHLTSDCKLTSYPNLRLHIQPGGDAYQQQLTLGAAGKQSINAYLDQGGAYLGICAGFFYASSDYYWKGTHYGSPAGGDWGIGLVNGGKLMLSKVPSTVSVNDGKWHAIVMTREQTGGAMQLFVDAKLEVTASSTPGKPLTGPPWLGLGCNPCKPTKSVAADYDELRFYPRIMTAAEIAQHFAAPRAMHRNHRIPGRWWEAGAGPQLHAAQPSASTPTEYGYPASRSAIEARTAAGTPV